MGVHNAFQSQFHDDVDSYMSEVEQGIGDLNDDSDSDEENLADRDFLKDSPNETNKEDDVTSHRDEFEDKIVSCFRFFILTLLVGGMIAAGVSSWKFVQNAETENFEAFKQSQG